MQTVHSVHGFNVHDGGEGTINKLGLGLEEEGRKYKSFDYGWLGLVGVHFLTNDIAKLLARRVSKGDDVIAHSHGSLIAMLAAEYGAEWGKVILFSPALRSDVLFPDGFEESHTVHNIYDQAIWAAVLLRRLLPNSWFGHPLWGSMGREGYSGIPTMLSLSLAISPVKEFFLSLAAIPLLIFLFLIVSPIEGILSVYFNLLRSRDREVRRIYLRASGYWAATIVLPVSGWVLITLLFF